MKHYNVAKSLLGATIKGIVVGSVLVVEAEKAQKELYLGFVLDRARRRVTLIASGEGGVDLEELARTKPDKIFRTEIDPFVGLHSFEAREAAGGNRPQRKDSVAVCINLPEGVHHFQRSGCRSRRIKSSRSYGGWIAHRAGREDNSG